MAISAKDGSALLTELTDDAVLSSNLFDHRIEGREAVIRAIQTIDAFYKMDTVSYRHRVAKREFIFTNLILADGQGAEVMTVGIRDATGWICALVMEHKPRKAAKALAAQVSAALTEKL